jgi:hypothetical protein
VDLFENTTAASDSESLPSLPMNGIRPALPCNPRMGLN